jgi:hypothetical protein
MTMTAPTAGAGEAAAAETTQSRGASASEALAILKAQLRDYRASLPRTLKSKVARAVARLLFMAIPALIGARYVGLMPALPLPVSIGIFVLLTVGSFSLLRYSYHWNWAELYRGGYQANRRFRIEQNALVITDASGVIQSVPWSAITNVVSHEGMLAIYFSAVNSACLLKAAHENQDAESFCADLMRHWQAHRGTTGAAA